MSISMRHIKIRGDMIDSKALGRAIENALTGAAKDVKIDLSVTTQTWRHRPDFEIEKSPGSRIIATDDEVYGWVDEGTRPFTMPPIVPKSKQALTIMGGGRPKTTPRVIGSGPGGRGGIVAIRSSTKSYQHPGITPREFTDEVKSKWDDRLPDVLQRALDSEL